MIRAYIILMLLVWTRKVDTASYSDSLSVLIVAVIFYYEETVAGKVCQVVVDYRQPNYTPRRKVIG